MENLNSLIAFVRTADLGSFVAASRVLGISPSAVGKAVTKLENQLGVRLFQRSTRSLRLTEEGRTFHERCQVILDDLNDAQDTLMRSRGAPRGIVKVSAPISAHHLLMPLMPKFLALYPEIAPEFDFTDRVVDLIEDGVDVAMRSGKLPDSRLMSRSLRPFQLLLCASPAYLERHGTPACPHDLCGHVGIGFRYPNSGKVDRWPLVTPQGEADFKIRHVMICNNVEALHEAVLRGIGIGCMPDFRVEESIRQGLLIPILVDYLDMPGQFHLIWPSSRHLSPKVRVLVDFLVTHLFAIDCTLPCIGNKNRAANKSVGS